MNSFAITTGDVDGIGLEVSAKALHHLGPQKNSLFFLFVSKSASKKYLSLIDKKFKRHRFSNALEAIDFLNSNKKSLQASLGKVLFEISSDLTPPEWVEQAAVLCNSGHLSGMVTAPLSKELVARIGWSDRGHTEILKRVTGVDQVYQAFVGKYFNVLLATAHVSLSQVSSLLTPKSLESTFHAAHTLRKILPRKLQSKPLAMLGLNPHAGEGGLIGIEEKNFISRFCSKHSLVGPLSPDAAFLKKNWSRFSAYIACYHDQGLIPFKIIHGQNSGVQVSIGLPFPRTSVDHGTAKDIFGKNCANANSMIEAIELALRLAKK